MSHFSTIVVTDKKPSEPYDAMQGPLMEQLLPFHEYECTGYKEYTEWVDETDEVMKRWSEGTTAFEDPDGKLWSYYDKRFYAKGPYDPNRPWESNREQHTGCPDGWKQRENVPFPEAGEHESVEEFAKEYFGHERRVIEGKEQYGRITNKNAKWDWWVVGGRWNGDLRSISRPGAKLDIVQMKDIDFVQIAAEQIEARRRFIKKTCAEILEKSGRTESWVRENWAAASKQLRDLRVEWSEAGKKGSFWDFLDDQRRRGGAFLSHQVEVWNVFGGLGSWIELDSESSIDEWEMLYKIDRFLPGRAFVHEKNWYQKGEMGWFGMSTEEVTEQVWLERKSEFIKTIPPDAWVSVVDCHI